jgi:hypothetical protein
MKKSFLSIILIAISVIAMVSCKKSNQVPNISQSFNSNDVASLLLCPNTYTCAISQSSMVQRDSTIGGAVLYANTSYGNYPVFKTESWITPTHIFDSRSFIKFNLPPNFFSGFTFCSAEVVLHQYLDPNCIGWLGFPNPYFFSQNPNNAARILRIKTPWNPNTASWNNQPQFALANSAIVPAIPTPQLSIVADNQVINVTNLMTDVQASGIDRGMAIAVPAIYPSLRARHFGSVNTMPAIQAQLVFHY